MSMTTIDAVAALLTAEGFPASVEYPGYIDIPAGATGDAFYAADADTNGAWSMSLVRDACVVNGWDLGFPRTSTDAPAIAAAIVSIIRSGVAS